MCCSLPNLKRSFSASLIALHNENLPDLLRVLRDQVELAHLQELRAIVRLLLQGRNGALERVHGLGVVLVRRQVVRVLHLAHLGTEPRASRTP